MASSQRRRGRRASSVEMGVEQGGLWVEVERRESGSPWGVPRALRLRGITEPAHRRPWVLPGAIARPIIPEGRRRCPRCKTTRPLTDFLTATGVRECYCGDCRRARRRKQYLERERDPLAAYGKHLRRVYRITLDQYHALYEAQGGVCAICGEPETQRGSGEGTSRRYGHLAVDHDHATGEVRALLCGRCNAGLGSFRDQPDLLVLAAQYLVRQERAS